MSERALVGMLPGSWTDHPNRHDYGIDIKVEIFDPRDNGDFIPSGDEFAVQLKSRPLMMRLPDGCASVLIGHTSSIGRACPIRPWLFATAQPTMRFMRCGPMIAVEPPKVSIAGGRGFISRMTTS